MRLDRRAVPLFLSLVLPLVLAVALLDPAPAGAQPNLAKATFAGGCFWCMEHPYDELDGVVSTTSGYIGGHKANPTYREVSSGTTGHAEAVEVVYDPRKISYEKLLEVFWMNVDPTDAGGQFCDRGSQYRTGIFYYTDEQKRLAEASKAALAKSKPFKEPLVTEITKAATFYPAEEYHQDYYLGLRARRAAQGAVGQGPRLTPREGLHSTIRRARLWRNRSNPATLRAVSWTSSGSSRRRATRRSPRRVSFFRRKLTRKLPCSAARYRPDFISARPRGRFPAGPGSCTAIRCPRHSYPVRACARIRRTRSSTAPGSTAPSTPRCPRRNSPATPRRYPIHFDYFDSW